MENKELNPQDERTEQEQRTEMECGQRSLPRAFRETEMLLHRYMASRRQEAFDPERGQGRILALLKRTGPLPQRDLAYLLGIRQQSLGELVRKLEENEFVTRAPQPDDKRVLIVALTEKGSELEMPRTPLAAVFDCLDEEEQQNLSTYLDRICARLAELLPEDPGAAWAGPDAGFEPGCRPGPHPGPRPGHGPCGFGPGPDGPHHHRHHRMPHCDYELHGWLKPARRDCF